MQKSLFENIPMSDVRQPALQQCSVSRSTFYQGDCLVEMDKIADKSVDMILCDLPYGTTACKWDSVIPFEPLWKHYERIIKDNGAIVLTATQPFTTVLISSNFGLFRYELIWDKIRAATGLNAAKMPMKTHENICVFYKKQPTYNPQMTEGKPFDKTKFNGYSLDAEVTGAGVFNSKKNEGFRFPVSIQKFSQNWTRQQQIHNTQKPVELMEYLIKTYTNEGETVLDNCMGSGTTGVACKKTGRHFIGIEKDPKYFEIAVSRVSAYCG